MEKEIEFKDDVEILEYLVGAKLENIERVIDIIPFPYARKIIELRYGLYDGKVYTLFEIPDILNKEDKEKGFTKLYMQSLNKCFIKPLGEEWDAEAVRKTEANTIHELRKLFKYLKD